MIAPPGFFGWCTTPQTGSPKLIGPFTQVFNGGNEYEYFDVIGDGDTLTATTALADLRERMGSPQTGRMLFIVNETTYKNQHGKVVAKGRFIAITYEGPKE